MAARSIQSKKGQHYLIEFGINKDLAIVSEDDLVFGCTSCAHQTGEKMEVYVLDKGDEKNMEQAVTGLHSYEELGPLPKKQRKETDAKYSKEGKAKGRKRKQQAHDGFAAIDVIYPDLQSNVTSSEVTDDVTITKVVQVSENKYNSDHTPPGSHSDGKASTSVPHKAISSPFQLKDYCPIIENIKARLNKIEDFLSIYCGYKKNDDNNPPTQLPSTSDAPQPSLPSRFMLPVPHLTDQFLGFPPPTKKIKPPTPAQQSGGSSVNLTKPGFYIRASPTQQASVTHSHAIPFTQKFTGASPHNSTRPPTVQQPLITPRSYIQARKQPMSLPQPPPLLHLPSHILKPNLLLLKEQSVSRSNFAKKLLASLISEDEWITLNVSGTRGKKQINPQVIEYVKLCAFSMYPLGVGENMEAAWKVCVKAIDAGARAIAKRKRESTCM